MALVSPFLLSVIGAGSGSHPLDQTAEFRMQHSAISDQHIHGIWFQCATRRRLSHPPFGAISSYGRSNSFARDKTYSRRTLWTVGHYHR
jgi:hypothetical protein